MSKHNKNSVTSGENKEYSVISATPSEFDRQMAIFAKKIENPDQIILACSLIKSEGDDGKGDVYNFLTTDDKLIRVTTRDEDIYKEEQTNGI